MCNSVKGGRNEGQDGLPPGHDVLVRQAQDYEPPQGDCGGFAVSRPVRRARSPAGGDCVRGALLIWMVRTIPRRGLRSLASVLTSTCPRAPRMGDCAGAFRSGTPPCLDCSRGRPPLPPQRPDRDTPEEPR